MEEIKKEKKDKEQANRKMKYEKYLSRKGGDR